ncbi:MAG: DUF58 domain-containing protein [Oscillospiraceae bacterium]
MKQPGSNFVTITGLAVLAVLVLVCAYLGYTLLEVFLVVILLLCLAAYLWARFSLGKIRVEFQESDCRAFPGQTLEAGARLVNAKFLPLLWLDLELPTGGKTCVAPAEEEESGEEAEKPAAIAENFSWIMPHQTLSWRQRALAVHRGVCAVDSVDLLSGDGFGLTVQRRRVPVPGGFRFVVYPQIIPVDITLILHNMSELEPVKSGFYTDRTLLSGIRDYRDGDSFRDINWRLLARSDSLQVNVHERLAMRRVCFVPDVQSFAYQAEVEVEREKKLVTLVHAGEMERMFSLLASMIAALNDREVLCTLVLPAIGEKEAQILIPQVRADQITEHLTALAELDYAGEETRLPLDEMLAEPHKLGRVYVLSKNLEKAIAPGLDGELGLIRILQEAGEDALAAGNIFSETDFLTL